jgi:hypothetical protein
MRSDKLFPALGFGAKLASGEVSHLFSLVIVLLISQLL